MTFPHVILVQQFAEVITGSHRATFDAVVVDGFQTGDSPSGTKISIQRGQVKLDGTAEVRGMLDLVTNGQRSDGESLFPAGPKSQYGPYGTEIFVRRGVDLGGGGVLWAPLGYFRINTGDQEGNAFDPLRITGSDRMATIVDSRLLAPRLYPLGTLVSDIFDDLVLEVYPDAVIEFDDGSGGSSLGRDVLVEESRYDALHDLATSLGKIMYFNGSGVLRIEDAPDPTEPIWTVNAGSRGVLVTANRRVTREGVYNAVVAIGQGGDQVEPVRGVATDQNPNSPTLFGGRFGRIPRFYSSPFLTTNQQAANAAAAILRRSIGVPYSVDFRAVPNPAVRPFDPVQVIHQDNTVETHVIERISIPLTFDAPLVANTREKTLVIIWQS